MIHPADPELVYVAALGPAFGPNEQRGVFRSRDGGANWEKVLYVSDKAGSTDLAMNPTNPRNLYANAGKRAAIRTSWSVAVRIQGSGALFRSNDYGDTWQCLSEDRDLRRRLPAQVGPCYDHHCFSFVL